MKPLLHRFPGCPRALRALGSSHLPLLSGLLVMALLAAGPGHAASRARVDDAVRDELRRSGSARVIVKMTDGSVHPFTASSRGAAVRRLTERVVEAVPELKVSHRYTLLPLVAGEVSAAAVDKLAALPEVEGVYPDRTMHALLDRSGPLVGQPEAEAAGYTGKGIGIAVIDTGVDYLHPALGGGATADFTDVKPGQWAWRYIQAAAEHGIVSGFPGGAYQPSTTVTRDQMAVFVARALAGGDANVPTGPEQASFSDVPVGSWAYKYIEYCKDKGIVTGFPGGGYGPTVPVNRGQMAVFIARAVAGGDDRVPTGPETATFPDVTTDGDWAWAYKYVEYATDQQIVKGYPNGNYSPEVEVTRDQMPVFVARAFHLEWSGRVIAGANLMSWAADRTNPMDDNGHGTTVAAIAASSNTTYRGMAPEANLIALKVLNSQGSGAESDVLRGVDWCVQNQAALNIRVINLSIGDSYAWASHEEADATPDGEAITAAVDAGIVVVVASGNEATTVGLSGISLPAACSDSLSVGATKDGGAESSAQPADGIAYYSDRGELLTMYAPGSDVTGPTLNGMETSGQGTSFSSPHVAGAAALLAGMGLTDAREIRARLARTGVQIVDPATGVATPRLDLRRAIDPPTSGPDLVVTAASTDTPDILAGGTIAASVTVKNQGNASSAATTLLVVASANTDASPQDPEVVSADIPALSPGESYSPPGLEGTVKVVAAGDYWLGAYVDDGYQVTETDETNNSLVGTVLHVGLRSARVESASMPTSAHVGQSVAVTVRMLNDGSEAWTPGEFALVPARSEDAGLWGVTQVSLPTTVNPGEDYTFAFSCTAPSETGAVPCYWQMAKGGERFGEIATGAEKSLALDAPTVTQANPTVSTSWAVFEDYSSNTHSVLKAVPHGGGTPVTIPDGIRPSTGWPSPTFQFFEDDYTDHLYPALSGNWLAWMVYDMPLNPNDYSDYWAYQVAAYDLSKASGTLPLRVTYGTGDAWLPDVDGTRVVWEDYRNDPDRMMDVDPANFLSDNPDIYLADLTDIVDQGNRRPKEYPICTAPGPQFAPRISGNLIVWEDWRDLEQGDIYCYDLSVDSDGDGIPNWKDSDRPNPDPAERRLTNTPTTEEYPDVSGHTVVWMDFRRDIGASPTADVYGLNLDTNEEFVVAADPQTYRQQPRIDGTQVAWEDWRTGLGSVYWTDLATGVTESLAGGFVDAGVPDLSASNVTYVEYRDADSTSGKDIYSVWVQTLHPYVQVVP